MASDLTAMPDVDNFQQVAPMGCSSKEQHAVFSLQI